MIAKIENLRVGNGHRTLCPASEERMLRFGKFLHAEYEDIGVAVHVVLLEGVGGFLLAFLALVVVSLPGEELIVKEVIDHSL